MRLFIVIFMALCAVAIAERPNIVFIFTDDHACQSIGAYGSKINKTPNIDRIANEGGIFLNSFCANSICGPSRASILTGKHSHKNGFKSNGAGKFNGAQFTFPQVMQKNGYIGDFEVIDDHRAGKIVIELIGRINKCGVISPRFDCATNEVEQWVQNVLPSRGFGSLVLTTTFGIMDHEESRRKKTGGKILGFFY